MGTDPVAVSESARFRREKYERWRLLRSSEVATWHGCWLSKGHQVTAGFSIPLVGTFHGKIQSLPKVL